MMIINDDVDHDDDDDDDRMRSKALVDVASWSCSDTSRSSRTISAARCAASRTA